MRRLLIPISMPVLLLVGVTACSESADDAAAPASQSTTLADCQRLVPDSVLETLGWTSMEPVELKAGRCTASGDDGIVQVHRVPVAGEDPQAAYDERCSEFDASPTLDDPPGDPQPGEVVDWLGDQQVCATPPDNPTGYAYALTLTADDELVEAFVAASTETPDDQVVRGLTELLEGYSS